MTAGVMDLFGELRAATPAEARPGTLREFLETDVVTEAGPWRLDGHEPLGEIVALIDKVTSERIAGAEISVLAAEQVGKTLIAAGTAFRLVSDQRRNVGYFLPTKESARAFGRTRIKRIVSRSPYLSARLRDREVVDQAALKEFDGRFLYILGLQSMLGAISIPLDALINDEVDHLPAENLEWAAGRVAHSDLRFTLNVSAGYTPGGGIDQRWQDGTMHKYLVRCATKSCRIEVCLEETFPACVARIRGVWTRICPDCQAPLNLARGRWVATYPEREKQNRWSYRVSSLIIPARHLDHTMGRWEKAKRRKSQLAKFRCAELAMPDAGAMQPVTDVELQRMQTRGRILQISQSGRPRFAGMDMGDLCHFWCHERDEHGRPVLVWLEEIDSDVAAERVPSLCAQLGVVSFVIDKKPLTNTARAICRGLGRIAALQDFHDSSELKVVEEDHEGTGYRCVKVNRDESLDDFTSEITSEIKGLIIPDLESSGALGVMATHLKALRKQRSTDAKGRVIDRYARGVPNHFGMAGNSARLAELVAPKYVPFEYAPIHGGGRIADRNRWKRSMIGGR